ncbi:MAG: GIY-YIG nuclease family protein [Dehalococcoidia bacterium]
MPRKDRITPDVRAVIAKLEDFLASRDETGRLVCGAKCGVYAFYDYDGEPIYVGQTYEKLRVRVRRHLTNQRTDAVAMHVLDPAEVARVELWPFWDIENEPTVQQRAVLARAEFTVFQKLTKEAQVSKLLNEMAPAPEDEIDLPPSYSAIIVPDDVRERLAHADERIARRAGTIANLAQVIRERDVSIGLRRTLVTQAERLLRLASQRLQQVEGATPVEEVAAETRREGPEEDQ